MDKQKEGKEIFSPDYWNDRYLNDQTGWDLGMPSPALMQYMGSIRNVSVKVLIPGAGRAYEAEALRKLGFENVFIVDWAKEALRAVKFRYPEFKDEFLINSDFFGIEGEFDIILEQTFFCALPPAMRKDYAKKASELLSPSGRLAGLLFDFPLTEEGPPFGGSKEEYTNLFEPYFDILHMDRAENSIAPRAGRELFIELKKRD